VGKQENEFKNKNQRKETKPERGEKVRGVSRKGTAKEE